MNSRRKKKNRVKWKGIPEKAFAKRKNVWEAGTRKNHGEGGGGQKKRVHFPA